MLLRSRGLRKRFVKEGTFEQWSEGLGHVGMVREVGGGRHSTHKEQVDEQKLED